MKLLLIIIAVCLPLWLIWEFLKFRLITLGLKIPIRSYLANGFTLFEAIKKDFLKINKSGNLGLQETTIEKVSSKISSLEKMMDIDNVVEIYSTFIWKYIYRNGKKINKSFLNLEDQKIIYALDTLDFNEKNGFYVIKPDTNHNEINKKFSN